MLKIVKKLFSKIARTEPKTNPVRKTPIFIVSFNRKWQLQRSLKSYEQLGNIRIIIHDNGSDEQDVIKYLKELESEGVIVYRSSKIKEKSELNNINESIDKYFRDKTKTNYIVTDPDIELLPGASNTLDVYNYFFEKFNDIDSIGPMLRIDDIPSEYPLRNNVINRHIQQFWGQKPEIGRIDNESIAYLKCKIDTSFSMHRAGSSFKRLSSGIRLYGKYSARHLDWYKSDIFEESYSNKSSSNISHWGNLHFYEEFKDDTLRHKEYFDIEDNEGTVNITKKRV